MRDHFLDLAGHAIGRLRGSEILLLNLAAERSDFIRFNRGRVRQPMSVTQAELTLTLIDGRRHDRISLGLAGSAADHAMVADALAELRTTLPALPEDPYLVVATDAPSTETVRRGVLPSPAQAVGDVVDAAAGADVVGLLASGPVVRGFASSLGQRHWHTVDAFLFDWSVYHGGTTGVNDNRANDQGAKDKAVKCSWAGDTWSRDTLLRHLEEARARLPLLGQPERALAPGPYRAYLAPAAMADLIGMFNWGGVSLRQQRTRQSPLQKLVDGEARFSPQLHVFEDTAGGMAPGFDPAGFVRPSRVTLVAGGLHDGALVSARSGMEYGVTANGANESESTESIAMAGGDLPEADVLAALDTGVYVSNLHYLNWSDPRDARATGMTRFASFWVEHGRIRAPLAVMRFDDTLYRMLGSELEALTRTPVWTMDAGTYQQRSVESSRVPGALLKSFALVL
jgi:predicted Zn-dependent protease